MIPASVTRLSSADGARPEERAPRITLVISGLGLGGAERVICALASKWHHRGHEVSVVTVGSRAGDVYELEPGVSRVALELARSSRNVLEGAFQASRRVLALRRALIALRPDVVVSFLERTNVLSLLALDGTGVPVLVCERSDPRHERIGTPWAALRRMTYPRAAGVVVQTESVARWAREFCARVHVIPNFVEAPGHLAAPGVDRGPRQLLAMGRLSREKGFDLLIEAFASAASSYPDWSLAILGEGPERKSLEALIGSLRLWSRVSLPGLVADPVTRLAAAHGFALPSRYEGFPNALLEGMACGLPAVAFDCPSGPADIIVHERNGLLVAPGDVPGLAMALRRIMGDPAERVRLGQSAREVSRSFGPDRVLDRWSALVHAPGGHDDPRRKH